MQSDGTINLYWQNIKKGIPVVGAYIMHDVILGEPPFLFNKEFTNLVKKEGHTVKRILINVHSFPPQTNWEAVRSFNIHQFDVYTELTYVDRVTEILTFFVNTDVPARETISVDFHQLIGDLYKMNGNFLSLENKYNYR